MSDIEKIPDEFLKEMLCPFEKEGTVDLAYCKSFAIGNGCRYLNKENNNCVYPTRQDKIIEEKV
jgi:hypothetical protein